jgi:hypothetical protein
VRVCARFERANALRLRIQPKVEFMQQAALAHAGLADDRQRDELSSAAKQPEGGLQPLQLVFPADKARLRVFDRASADPGRARNFAGD